jgi:hypothetical protein
MNLYTKTFANEDISGNRVIMSIYYDENNNQQNATIKLHLKEEKDSRQLGTFDFKTKIFYCKRNTAKHLHRKSNSFGFNWTVLNDAYLSVEKVHIIVDEEEHFEFPISLIKDYGHFLNFKQQGFELQRFMSFELIKRYSKIPRKPLNDGKDSTPESESPTKD